MHDLKRLLAEKERQLILQRTRFAVMVLGTPLVLSFSLIDYLTKPAFFFQFTCARLLVIPVCIVAYLLLKNEKFNLMYPTFVAHLFTLFLGSYTAYMIYLDGPYSSTYYAGVNLALVGAFSLLPYRPVDLIISGVTIVGPYILVCLLEYGKFNFIGFTSNAAFIGSTVFISVSINFLTRALRKSEISHEIELNKLIAQQSETIDLKTQESIKFKSLALQFSPQVIEAIKLGHIDLDKKSRKKVCVIFIDIVDSSRRSVNIDHDDFSKTVSRFFKEAIDILLKNNVTVGTFLGDGLLGFTNAPMADSNYRRSVFDAAIEIINYRNASKEFFKEMWKKDFNIRIGISEGYAIFGFFPSKKTGIYTGIGDSINFTSRLCAAAAENSICVDKSLLMDMLTESGSVKDQVVVEKISAELKGFEDRSYELFCLKLKDEGGTRKIDSCPNCFTAVLDSVEDLGNAILMKCPSCGYTDIKELDRKKLVS